MLHFLTSCSGDVHCVKYFHLFETKRLNCIYFRGKTMGVHFNILDKVKGVKFYKQKETWVAIIMHYFFKTHC